MSKEVPDFEIPVGEAVRPEQSLSMRRVKARKLLEKETAKVALKQAFVMLRPDLQWNNPVMFVVLVGAVLTLLYIVEAALGGYHEPGVHWLLYSPRCMAFFDGAFRKFRHRPCGGSWQSPG